jgi:aconitate hydratase
MAFDIDMIRQAYRELPGKIENARKMLGRPMTLADKILYSHLHPESGLKEFARGKDYVFFQPDRVAMQDATAQMALLQFMMCGRDKTAVPTTVHCDHLILAKQGADEDLKTALDSGDPEPVSYTRSYWKIMRFPEE